MAPRVDERNATVENARTPATADDRKFRPTSVKLAASRMHPRIIAAVLN
jgi:hypothetical protein